MTNDFAIVGAATAVVALATLLAYKTVAMTGTADQLANYTDTRRVISFMVPCLALGFGVTIPLAIARGKSRLDALKQLGQAFLLATSLALAAIMPILFRGRRAYSSFLAVDVHTALLIVACGWTLVLSGLLFAFHRGFQDFKRGAVITVLVNGFSALIAVGFIGRGLSVVLAIWTVGNLSVICWGLRGHWRAVLNVEFSFDWRFISRSLSRVPGDVAFAALFLIPVLTAHGRGNASERAVFNYGFVLIGMTVALSAPIGVVLLPRVAEASVVNFRRLRRLTFVTVASALGIGGILIAVLNLAATNVVDILLSVKYQDEAALLEQMSVGIAGVTVFLFVRNILDGLTSWPVSPTICVVSLALYFGLSVKAVTISETTVAVDLAFTFMGVAALVAVLVLVNLRRLRL